MWGFFCLMWTAYFSSFIRILENDSVTSSDVLHWRVAFKDHHLTCYRLFYWPTASLCVSLLDWCWPVGHWDRLRVRTAGFFVVIFLCACWSGERGQSCNPMRAPTRRTSEPARPKHWKKPGRTAGLRQIIQKMNTFDFWDFTNNGPLFSQFINPVFFLYPSDLKLLIWRWRHITIAASTWTAADSKQPISTNNNKNKINPIFQFLTIHRVEIV